MAPSSSSATTSVQVALRIRPPTQQDNTSIPARFQRPVIHAASSTSVEVEMTPSATAGPGAPTAAGAKKQYFTFDQVHGPSTTQHEMFTTTAEPLITRFVDGFNCTVLAYGQTSSGKTFTMTGMDLDADPTDPSNGMGIIPRAVSGIFARARQLKEEKGSAWTFGLKGSFIEIYNEDLIDLLAIDDGSGGRREVQIREEKGHIIWAGLREVNVKSSGEVMSLIRQGTSIRRTNETSMNAQSSRSHAIFSLTLTQKKYTGSGPPPRSSSPLPPHGRSPSRLARPGSMYQGGPGGSTRVSSPTFGRPATPSFASAIGRGGGGGLRPSSALGHAGDRSPHGGEDDAGEWVTIVSKFHFVDLAGSERLKRTAAAGERIKEGISINGGLLALGNVISALGDPTRSKSNTAIHVPYRDSKLTRLLQDSLGGNSHTLMIACVSPAEYNANETVNTLKYANRARNIKNRAVVNQKEDGWDDVEWLQTTVGRLRKELKTLKEGGVIEPEARNHDAVEGVGKKVLAQMTDLQNNYETLRERFVERTEELTRLRGELGESHRDGMSVTGTGKYEEIVGPVIEEYEKTISTMEAELSLNRVALSHTNELVAEKEQELAAVTERHSATELYVEELRARVSKLSEREASTEAYVRDLEEKMKSYDESSINSSASMGDLKREVTRFRDVESYSTKYITDLEARLAKSDESILSLQQTVERLERECESRRDAAEALQSRLDTLRQDSESWRSDLEQRENRVRDLEEQMIQWERKMQEAGDTRQRLGSVVSEVESARRDLDSESTPTNESTDNELSPVGERAPSINHVSRSPSRGDIAVEKQFSDLQETHQATLADLASVTNKYRDALREISDLADQIQEAKLSGQASTESPLVDKFYSESTSPARRRITGIRRETSEPQYNAAGRRLFFRQAASTESLHARSLSQSQSLSQELSSVHSRKASFSSYGSSSSHSPSNSQSAFGSRPNLSISLPSTTPGPASERSAVSLEKEIMRLQEVLKERENEITLLETTLRESRDTNVNGTSTTAHIGETEDMTLSPKTIGTFNSLRKSMEMNGNHLPENGSATPTDSDQADESLERLNELMLSMAQKESSHREVVTDLSTQLAQVRKQFDDLTVVSRDQTANMSAEMDALRGRHEDDMQKLDTFQKREAELVESLRAAEAEHATAIEILRVEHEKALGDKVAELDHAMTLMTNEHNTALAATRDELASLSAALSQAKEDHENAFGKLRNEHAEILASKLREADDILVKTRQEHEVAFQTVKAEHEDLIKEQEEKHSSALHETEEQYYNALTKLRRDHAEALEARSAESLASIERLKESHAADIKMAEIAREGTLSESQSSRDLALKELQDAHASAIAQKEASFEMEVTSLQAEHQRALELKQGDFELLMDKLRNEHEGVLKRMREELKVEFNAALSEKTKEHSQVLESTKSEHNDALSKLRAHFEAERAGLLSEHEAQVKAAAELSSKAQAELDSALRETKEQHAMLLQDIGRSHQEELEQLKASHSEALTTLKTQSEDATSSLTSSHTAELGKLREEQTSHRQQLEDLNRVKEDHLAQFQSLKAESDNALASMLKSHTEESLKLKTDHETSLARLEESIVALKLDHTHALEASRKEAQQILEEEKSRLQEALDSLARDHAAECETLRKDHDLLTQEFELHKATSGQSTAAAIENHEKTLQSHSSAVQEWEEKLGSSNRERDDLAAEVQRLREELDSTKGAQTKLVQEASKRESLTMELERHRSVLAELQESLQRVKDEKDVLQTEKIKSDSLARDLQAQLARSAPIPASRQTPERVMSHQRPTALKLPPPTPPPSVPPPPAPRHNTGEAGMSMSSQASSALTASTSARDSFMPDSPSTSVFSPVSTPPVVDVKRLEQQAKKIEEQETMIKTLNKQLTHCESDLQTHMDLVSTLETSLGDSEKNLRKARMHATELARERDGLTNQVEALRNEVQSSKQEVDNVRRSIVVEKQSYEQRLDEERKAKDRARQQLDSRMEELQKRKSKFACL